MARTKKTDQTEAPNQARTLEQELAAIQTEREEQTATLAALRGQLVEAEGALASAEAAAVQTDDASPEWDVFYRDEKRVSQLRARIRAAEAKAAALAEAEAAAQRAIWQYALDRSLELASDETLRAETEEAVELQLQITALEARRNDIVVRAAQRQNIAVDMAIEHGAKLGLSKTEIARRVNRSSSPIGYTSHTADHSLVRPPQAVFNWVLLRAAASGPNPPRLDEQQQRLVNVGLRSTVPAVEDAAE